MPQFRIPVSFTVDATVIVEADDYEAACEAAYEAPLPPQSEWTYLDDSFQVREEDEYEVQDADTGEWEMHDPDPLSSKEEDGASTHGSGDFHQLTKWICPVCRTEREMTASDLAEVGTPFCMTCAEDFGKDDQELEPA